MKFIDNVGGQSGIIGSKIALRVCGDFIAPYIKI
jgi:hypothetical protein